MDITLSLVSHTNVGKTTLARTLLGRDIGEVRDAPHVTDLAERHELIGSAEGDRLWLWDTPGFGDSVRLVRRLRQTEQPLGWLLAQLWDRWRDRAFWASQQALRHVREHSDVLLYLVNASEPAAPWLGSEMQLLGWVGKPVIVLLNQLGPPRAPADEAAELRQWRERLAPWPQVRAVLPLDAFARCWVQEGQLLQQVQRALAPPQAAAMARLAAAWAAAREALFEASMTALAASVARSVSARVPLAEPAGLAGRLRELGARALGQAGSDEADPARQARQALATALQAEVRSSTAQLLHLHGLRRGGDGAAADAATDQVLARVAALESAVAEHRRVPEGRAALVGGALSGALAGLKADIASGGLTLGGGLLAGGLLGALGAAGLARGVNVLRDTGRSWVAWDPSVLSAIVQAALLRYLAVAHFGRGRGDWTQGEAPPHWVAVVQHALAPEHEALAALWRGRSTRLDNAGETDRLARALAPHLTAAGRAALSVLYPPHP